MVMVLLLPSETTAKETKAARRASCGSLLSVMDSWNTGWNGEVTIPILSSITSWTVDIQFTAPVKRFKQWTGETTKHSRKHYSVYQDSDNLSAGDTLVFEILYWFKKRGRVPSIRSIKLNGQDMCIRAGFGCTAEGSPYDYDEVLHKSLLFYEAQRSGFLPDSQRVTWRKDSATDDAIDDETDEPIDLEGGYYDAGDYMKLGYPMASMTTVLAWGAIEYGDAYTAAGEMSYMKEAVKWATDYFIKAHPEANVFYGQVGLTSLDHDYVGRPEDMTMNRPAFKITTSNPGSDLAGETAAALAAASILFQDSEPIYASTCLQHAEELYDFANQYQGEYADSITDAADSYGSYGLYDELAWAAAWLYRATGDVNYLADAKDHYDQISIYDISEFSWAEKAPGVQVLLAEYADESDRSMYLDDLEIFCDKIIDNTDRTPLGLVYISKWGSLRYAANAAFVCLRAADLDISPTKYREFAKQQIHYMLGEGGRSYVVGFGENPPVHPHHASSACPSAPAFCGWTTFDSNEPNAHVLTGALVGGPDEDDNYVDDRSDYIQNEVTTDYNAGFQSAVAALRVLANCGT